jgi:hypothetical protein
MWIVNTTDETTSEPPPQTKLYLDDGEERRLDIKASEPGWKIVAHGPVALEAYNVIDIGGVESDPRGSASVPGDERALVPRLPYGALVAKIGERGEPFAVEWYTVISMKDIVYVAVNDSEYSDNSGSFTLIATGRRSR